VAIALEEFELGARASCNITKKKRRAGRNARLQGWSKALWCVVHVTPKQAATMGIADRDWALAFVRPGKPWHGRTSHPSAPTLS
jgi:hypothetical protein